MENVELHIAGKGTESEAMHNLFVGLDCVTFHGDLDKQEVRELLYQSDALVLASRSEAQGLVIMEAISTGIPVVTTDIIPKNALVKGACLIAKAGDSMSLRERMQEVIHVEFDPQWSDELRTRVAPDVVAQQIMKVFSQD